MQPRPSLDLELLILIAVGIVSTLVLGWFFLTNDLSESPIPPTIEPTAIPSGFTPLATRTPSPPSATPTQEETLPPATETSPVAYPGPPVETLSSASTLVAGSQSASFATSTSDQLLPVGKHDDTDPRIDYDRHWAFKMNSGTSFAYKGTLHVSAGIGNEVSFQFTGQRFYLGYQRGRNFGIMTVMIDGQPYSFHQQAFDRIWRSPQLSPGTHSVRLIHESGESINLDYIEILD
jgi:hypothetical protein